MLWDLSACQPLALIATTAFNNHRTGAGLAVAADVLAPQDARTLTIFGAGKIAPAVLQYLAAVRPFDKIFILGHGSARARELAMSIAQWPALAHCTVSAEVDSGTGGPGSRHCRHRHNVEHPRILRPISEAGRISNTRGSQPAGRTRGRRRPDWPRPGLRRSP